MGGMRVFCVPVLQKKRGLRLDGRDSGGLREYTEKFPAVLDNLPALWYNMYNKSYI